MGNYKEIKLSSFFKELTIFTLGISLIAFLVYQFLLTEYYLKVFPIIIIYFYLANTISFLLLKKSRLVNQVKFNTKLSLSTMIRLFGSLLFVSIYVVFNKDTAFGFVLVFGLAYVLFTILEVRTNLRLVKGAK